MHPVLQQFLSRFPELQPEEQTLLGQQLKVQDYPKGTLLLQEGQACTVCYFVLQGCLRQYQLIDGLEKTTRFYTEYQAAVQLSQYSCQGPSDSYLVCVEDCVLLIGHQEEEQSFYQQYPQLLDITRNMITADLAHTQDMLSRFILQSPEERYRYLQETNPDLLNRVPQHQLASYIGVTPESLSRIRKRMRNREQKHG